MRCQAVFKRIEVTVMLSSWITFTANNSETISQAGNFGIRFMVFEINCRFSVGVTPTHPKPVSRMVANQMGDSVRIAGKYLASNCTGRVTEPRNRVLSCS